MPLPLPSLLLVFVLLSSFWSARGYAGQCSQASFHCYCGKYRRHGGVVCNGHGTATLFPGILGSLYGFYRCSCHNGWSAKCCSVPLPAEGCAFGWQRGGRRLQAPSDCKCLTIEVIRTTEVAAGSEYAAAVAGTVLVYASTGSALTEGDIIWSGRTLELPYRGNQQDVSSVPPTSLTPYADYDDDVAGGFTDGEHTVDGGGLWPRDAEVFYRAERLGSSKSGLHDGQGLYLVDKSWSASQTRSFGSRSDVKFHVGNHAGQTSGCILLGKDVIIDSKGARLQGGREDGSAAATGEFYDIVDRYAAQGYELRVKVTQATPDSNAFDAREITEEALSELSEVLSVPRSGKFPRAKVRAGVSARASCKVSELSECWEELKASIVIVVSFTITFSSCIDADTLIETAERGLVPAGLLKKGELIAGDRGDGRHAWCTVTSHSGHGSGYISGNFTPDHLVIDLDASTGEYRLRPNGNGDGDAAGPTFMPLAGMRMASLVNIATDCHMAKTADGQRFTPFSTAFCPANLSYASYVRVLAAVQQLTLRGQVDLALLWAPQSWHDNVSHPLRSALQELCATVAHCASGQECAAFEQSMQALLDSNLDVSLKPRVLAAWASPVDMASAIKPKRGDFDLVFILAAALALTSLLCCCLCLYSLRRCRQRAQAQAQEPGLKGLEADACTPVPDVL